MKKLVTTMFLICAAMLLVSPPAGFAYQNVNQQGCLATGCHVAGLPGSTTPGQLHNIHSTLGCASCHPGGAGQKGNVEASACVVCHPRVGGTGVCQLIDAPVHAGTKQTCLACHASGPPTPCAPPATTTTVPANTTTTTPSETTTTTPSETTTTTAPAGCILTIDPAAIEVDGTTDVTEDVKVTIDAGSLTEADLQGLDVSFSDACSQYITVNTVNNIAISGKKAEATVNITVKGNAASSECKLIAKNTSGTINCETKFTITSTAVPECKINSITPSTVRVGFGILPRIQRFVFTFNIDVEAIGITPDDIKVDTPNATIFYAKISGNTITAWAVLSGLKPDTTYYFTVGECGRYSIDTKGFFQTRNYDSIEAVSKGRDISDDPALF